MMPEETLRALPDPVQRHFARLEGYVVRVIAKHIGGTLGRATTTDTHRMMELQRMGANLRHIDAEIARTVGLAERDVQRIMQEASRREYRGVAAHARAWDSPLPPHEANRNLQRLVEQASRATAGTFANISDSRAVGMVDRMGQVRPLPDFYREFIDYAVLKSRMGMEDWNIITRNTVRDMADGGLRRLAWASGYTQRVDTSVRRNVLGGLARLSLEQAEMLAEEIGADGMEITWHDGYRPSHDFGGRQVTMLEWRTNYRLRLMEPNCYHRAFAIILGVSTPAYTDDWIAERRAANERKFTIDNMTFNRYKAEQAQRRFEAEIRESKQRVSAFEASGHKKDAMEERYALARTESAYLSFSEKAGLPVRPNRVWEWGGDASWPRFAGYPYR